MRRIAIVGGGQAGLPLAFGLLDKGYEVTVVSNRTPDDIRRGKVMSSQCMFDPALQIERELGINDWEADCPPVEGIGFAVPHPEQAGAKAIEWSARLDRPAQSVDQRVKMPAWLEQVQARGGRLLLQDAGIAELEALAQSHDLVILAAGKGEVVKLFERDAARSPFDKPQRALALTYVHGLEPAPDYSRVAFNLIPGVGEYFVFPALTLSGPCDIMVFEGVPGGPLDCWRDVRTPQEHLAASRRFLQTYLPWEADRARNVELTDDKGILAGAFAPTVRKPVMTLPSGRLVFGLGDAVVTNDPITGQGANNATKACKVYLDAILARGEQPYTRDWMEATFEQFWDYAQWVVQWTNSLLTPPPPHILGLLGTAEQAPSLASTIANGFNHPPSYFPWWADAQACEGFIAQHQRTPATATATA
ncbi:FAD-binding oxidoreductase [Ralstonia pseudosolanacearum]|nr:styrene monooxygenase/indole monooxygenase family protein [Ralstonia pseudosolanacearum]AZU55995.1 alanine-phosphoribitol ligase [Ralstonia solanacearum]MCK4137818.1 FAD-binding oxidoreductase [Ralstonia pseudosolanacearum]RAA10743.1 FAD-binding oxidoreductase [Ralstonia pseudosolanacearum]UQY81037.1 FAD-binding oxidoreductase [Ralstonia pseudosolanacearum]